MNRNDSVTLDLTVYSIYPGSPCFRLVRFLPASVPLLTFPSPLHSPRRARSVGDGDGKGNRMSTEPDPTTDGTGRERVKRERKGWDGGWNEETDQ